MMKSTEQLPETEQQSSGILFHRNDFKDVTGCLKPEAHNDHHICKTSNGKLMAWEDDYTCTCGCWDEYEAGDEEVCIVFCEVESINSPNPFSQ